MTNQTQLIQRLKKWQEEWDQLITETQLNPDQKIPQLLKSYKPQFQHLIRSLQTDTLQAQTHQGEFFPESTPSARMEKIVDRLIEKIDNLPLPSLANKRTSHARRRN
ncbi:MAG: hypothetical protein COV74_10260 [Candidatus Omnitrophica bacterium CG11_big_fil_rev_8_21_14_0_20_45_26]|uniref:Uncharacterized protein n=1 Tax=Candidatus Abzuiibacterium crystallinum TaxID=1974748 RepID=A0A2H0LKV8_9BACT|nr:MAG: hypothetical protein COV74_10260 [Candidatus Omnitrophica bacterium CG11_big_fil_rev_8_21_14_0_20_45_26]PIW63947.1 MAG: hypothetical protein COW12_08560 [Candidatus Omnitrophica bacterium CG12_big_fil_rev_8_21_14_0_65_45_16]